MLLQHILILTGLVWIPPLVTGPNYVGLYNDKAYLQTFEIIGGFFAVLFAAPFNAIKADIRRWELEP